MSIFLDHVKRDFIDKKMKIVESSYQRRNKLAKKVITIPVFHFVWTNGDKQQISKYAIDSFLEEVKSDIINLQL